MLKIYGIVDHTGAFQTFYWLIILVEQSNICCMKNNNMTRYDTSYVLQRWQKLIRGLASISRLTPTGTNSLLCFTPEHLQVSKLIIHA
jgi:hypothetical protein